MLASEFSVVYFRNTLVNISVLYLHLPLRNVFMFPWKLSDLVRALSCGFFPYVCGADITDILSLYDGWPAA